MKKPVKIILSLALTILLLLPCVTALAAPQPRWTEISLFSYNMSNHDALFSNASVGTYVNCYSAYSKVTVTVTVQKRTSGGWVDTNFTWTDSDTAGVYIEKKINLPEGNYRSKSVAVIYSSKDVYIETVTKYSTDIVI